LIKLDFFEDLINQDKSLNPNIKKFFNNNIVQFQNKVKLFKKAVYIEAEKA
jgi:hypothetical protein